MSVAGRSLSPGAIAPSVAGVGGLARALVLLAICAIPVVLYVPFLTEPFFRDEGLYATVAQMMLNGQVPYEDAFDNKPPMIFAWYGLSFVLFGDNVWAPRLLVALLLSGTTYVMYLEGRLLWSHRSGLVAAGALALSLGLATLETGANTEFFLIPPLVGSLYAFSKAQKTESGWWYAAAGFLSAIAVATKHISIFVFVLYVVLAAWPLARDQGARAIASREFRRSAGGLAAGALLATGIVLLPFVVTGTLPDLWEATVVYTLKYVGDVPMSAKLEILRRSPLYLTFVMGPWALLSIFAVVQVVRSGGGGHGPLVIGFMAANWLGIIAAGRFYDHYYVTLLPAAALMAPLGARYVRERLSNRSFRYGFAIVFVLLAVPVVTQNAEIYLQPTGAERHIAKYPLDDRAPWENQGPAFGEWIAARTEPGDKIYNFGFQSELYFYADRYSPTRFILDRPFWTNQGYVEEALVELNADPPVYVIDSAVNEEWTEQKLYTPEIKAWVVENYDYVGEMYYAEVWRLKSANE